ncbi:hypothetical protein JK636_21950 [Clostridium sp. YIM B02515]|uniref:Uncharacterized protein n=1 Tax=Clostridium rhizosphaerae TaxID=2803861 RepID=A0ABS1TGM4_9CLOT|nr:hypothetical protein [Clostridium rhizosphaerae]MBL4938381.1 hypothetical protein [Clostridium rhizosphaerae]
MKNNDFFNFKFLNKYYVKNKEKEIKRLEDLKLKLLEDIEEEKLKQQKNEISLEKLTYENSQLNSQYNNLLNIAVNRGLISNIENTNFNIKEWDNLYIYKKSGKYFLKDKNNIDYGSLEKDITELLDDIFKRGFNCSIVVIRATNKIVKIQIRFFKKEE